MFVQKIFLFLALIHQTSPLTKADLFTDFISVFGSKGLKSDKLPVHVFEIDEDAKDEVRGRFACRCIADIDVCRQDESAVTAVLGRLDGQHRGLLGCLVIRSIRPFSDLKRFSHSGQHGCRPDNSSTALLREPG